MTRSATTVTALLMAVAATISGGTAASAQPTCSDVGLDIEVHGQHVVRDYVTDAGTAATWPPRGMGQSIASEGAAVPGGPGPGFHFPNDIAPGASFCLVQSQSRGMHVGD